MPKKRNGIWKLQVSCMFHMDSFSTDLWCLNSYFNEKQTLPSPVEICKQHKRLKILAIQYPKEAMTEKLYIPLVVSYLKHCQSTL